MDFGEKMKELNMTVEEIDRFTKAFKDEKFREMLCAYTREISDPENKKKYEADIKQLELERGNNIELIDPQPLKVLRTSLDGKQKCFVNICTNEKIGKPEFKWNISEDGRRGQDWSIPNTATPGRQDKDAKGNKFMIYDVIFHPDTIHIATKNTRFMDMVENIAVRAIQDNFKVKLDKNTRELTIKYKGSPLTYMIRNPVPGYTPREPLAQLNPLTFPYPDEKKLTSATAEPAEAPKTKDSGDVKPRAFQVELPKPQEPIIPHYTMKYRSFIDLQDFRYSRDSAQSPRPKEIVVIVDMPLLKCVRDFNLEVRDKSLQLESQKPAYRLEVALAYPVDEDKGTAKFNKQKGQLIITLPVLPSKESFSFAEAPTSTVQEREEEGVGGLEEKLNGQENEDEKREEEERRNGEEGNEKSTDSEDHEGRSDKGDTATQTEGSSAAAFKRDNALCRIDMSTEEDKSEDVHHIGQSTEEDKSEDVLHAGLSTEKDKPEDVLHAGLSTEKDKSEDVLHTDLSTEGDKSDDVHHIDQSTEEDKAEDVLLTGLSTEEENPEGVGNGNITPPEDENQPISRLRNNDKVAEQSKGIGEEGSASPDHSDELRAQVQTSEVSKETRKSDENEDYSNRNLNKMETDPSLLNQKSSETSQTAAGLPPDPDHNNNLTKDCSMSQGNEDIQKMSTPNKAKKSRKRIAHKKRVKFSEEVAMDPAKAEESEEIDEDDLPTEQTFPDHDGKPLPALLRESNGNGKETVIGDHSTSAGFTFQNSLLYELD